MIWYNTMMKVDKKLKSCFIEYTNTYFNLAIPKRHPKCSTTYLGYAIINLALAYLMTKEERYLARAKDFMNGVCSYTKWGNAHLVNVDLSASFILFGLSLGYNYLESYLTKEEKKKYLKNIKEHAHIMYEYKINNINNGWPTNYWQNHNWINHTAILLAGSILKEDKLINEALENFKIVFKNLAEDGSNYEGVSYWRYGGMWLFIAAWLIKELGYYDYFKEVKYLENTFYYRLYQSDSTLLKQLNFGDCHDRYSSHSLVVYYLIAKYYNNPYAKYLADKVLDNIYQEQYLSHIKPGILPELGLSMLAYSNIKAKDVKELPLYRYFEDLGLIAIRNSWSKDSIVFSLKCGYPGGKTQWLNGNFNTMALSHHHPDNLSYILTKGNDYFVIDDGYNRNILAKNHNVLLVDDRLTDIENKNDIYLASIKDRLNKYEDYNYLNYHGDIKKIVYQDNYLALEAVNTNIYPLDLNINEVKRVVCIVKDIKYIIFLDVFKSRDKHNYKSIINSDYVPKIKGDLAIYQGLDSKMYHYVNSNLKLSSTNFKQTIKSIMTTQEPDNYVLTNMYSTSYEVEGNDAVIVEILACNKLKVVKKDNYYLINNEDKLYYNISKEYSDALGILITKEKIIVLDGSYLYFNNNVLLESREKSNYIIEVKDEIFK